MLNKQPNDPDVAGVGEFVEENFYNLGLADHPLQALAREARNDPFFRDEGRREITGNEDDAFKFRTLTLRQLRDGRNYMHNALFTSVREVVEYFNAGVPQDEEAGATATDRFTNPRGPGFPPGLGLSRRAVKDLTAFLDNALYDPAFVTFDPDSTTDLFQLSERDLTYSVYRPDLAALGAVDGFPLSGLAEDNDDPLSRRDQGLEFLDVTAQTGVAKVRSRGGRGRVQRDVLKLTNDSRSTIDTHLLVIFQGLPPGTRIRGDSETTSGGEPLVRLFLNDGVLLPGQSIVESFTFIKPRSSTRQPLSYTLKLLSGQGTP